VEADNIYLLYYKGHYILKYYNISDVSQWECGGVFAIAIKSSKIIRANWARAYITGYSNKIGSYKFAWAIYIKCRHTVEKYHQIQ